MSIKLRIILICLILLTGVILTSQIKKRNLELKYTLSWIFLLFIVLLVTLFPSILNFISNIFGVELPINMVFFLGFLFTLLIVYRLTQAASKMSQQITKLTQEVALLEKQLREKQ